MLQLWLIKAQNMLKREEGQGLVEYALIILLISIVVIVILGTLGEEVDAVFQNIVDEFQRVNT